MSVRLLRSNRSFRGLVGAQLLGAFNDNLYKQLLLFLAAATLFPGQDKQGLAFAVFALPFVVFSGLAGDLSERLPKRQVIVWMKVAEIGVMALGAVALHLRNWPLLLVVLGVMGLQSAFFGPSKYGVIPELVTERDLLSANGTITMTTFLAVLLGQALAGPLLDGLGDALWAPGVVCVGFAVIGTFFARTMAPTPIQKPNLRISANPFGRLFETISALKTQRGLFSVVVLNSFFWFNGGVLQQAITAFGMPDYLAVGEGEKTLLSLLMVTMAVSIMVGSLAAPRLSRWLSAGRLATMGAALMVCAQASLMLLGPVFDRAHHGFLFAHVVLAVVGVAGALVVVPVQAYLQDAPPQGMRGQTFAVNNFMNFLFMFLGGLFYMGLREGLGFGPTVTQLLAAALMLGYLVVRRRVVWSMSIGS